MKKIKKTAPPIPPTYAETVEWAESYSQYPWENVLRHPARSKASTPNHISIEVWDENGFRAIDDPTLEQAKEFLKK